MGIREDLSLPPDADVTEIAEALGLSPVSPHKCPLIARWYLACKLAQHLAPTDIPRTAGELLIPIVDASPEVLSEEWLAPLPACYLRVAEVTGRPTAVVRRGWHRLRGGPGLPRSQEMLEVLAFGRKRPKVERVVCGIDVVLAA